MVISSSTVVFPNNAVNLIASRVHVMDASLFITKRPLRNTDPNQSVGVFASLWTPDENAFEMRGPGFSDSSVETYIIAIQGFIKDMDEEKGLATHSVLSEMLRGLLYRDATTRVGLSSLNTNLNGVQKQCQRWGIRQQRYFSNELSGSWLYLSTLEFWLEVETS